MTFVEILLLLLLAAVIGLIGQALAGFTAGGLLISIVVGFVGALLGRWLAGELDLPVLLSVTIDGEAFPLIWSIVGAGLFSLILGLLRSSARR